VKTTLPFEAAQCWSLIVFCGFFIFRGGGAAPTIVHQRHIINYLVIFIKISKEIHKQLRIRRVLFTFID